MAAAPRAIPARPTPTPIPACAPVDNPLGLALALGDGDGVAWSVDATVESVSTPDCVGPVVGPGELEVDEVDVVDEVAESKLNVFYWVQPLLAIPSSRQIRHGRDIG